MVTTSPSAFALKNSSADCTECIHVIHEIHPASAGSMEELIFCPYMHNQHTLCALRIFGLQCLYTDILVILCQFPELAIASFIVFNRQNSSRIRENADSHAKSAQNQLRFFNHTSVTGSQIASTFRTVRNDIFNFLRFLRKHGLLSKPADRPYRQRRPRMAATFSAVISSMEKMSRNVEKKQR